MTFIRHGTEASMTGPADVDYQDWNSGNVGARDDLFIRFFYLGMKSNSLSTCCGGDFHSCGKSQVIYCMIFVFVEITIYFCQSQEVPNLCKILLEEHSLYLRSTTG